MNNQRVKIITAFVITTLLVNSTPAYAYLDPGTGSVLLQGLIGFFVAALAALRVYWYQLLRLLGFRKEEAHNDERPSLENPNKSDD